MIDIGIAVLGGILYFSGQYGRALFLIVLAIISGVGAVVIALVNPDWHFQKRILSGLEVDIFNSRKGIASLLITKAIIIGALTWIAWHIAQKAGYV
jgi:hypothetical protein